MNSEARDAKLRRWLKGTGAFLILVAVLVLMGRFAGVRMLVILVPSGAPMAFPTAMGLLLLGGTFLAEGARQNRYSVLGAFALVIFGLVTLALYGAAEPLGLAGLVYNPARSSVAAGVGFDGRISTNTALSLGLCGILFMLLRAREFRLSVTGTVLAMLLAIALLAIVSHTTGLRSAVAWWRYTGMAVHTAMALLVAVVAFFVWLRCRIAEADRAVARTVPFFIASGSAVLVLCAVVLVSNEERQAAARLERRALQVGAAIDRFIAGIARLESATRAYSLTGDDQLIQRLEVHRTSVAAAAEELVQLTVNADDQHARALALRPLVAEKFTVNEEQVIARRDHGTAAAAAVLQAEAPELMAGLRAITDGLQQEEQRILVQRRRETVVNEERLRWVLIAGGLVTVGLVCGAFSLVQRAQRELQVANEHLEERVRQRTAELETTTAQVGERERRLRFLADTMPQLVWTARADGIIETLNQGWRDYLGVKTEAEARLGYASAVHPADLSVTARSWEAMLREQRASGGEARLRRADGAYRWHLWRAHPERAATGEIMRWVGTWTDIHDQKTAEAELERRVTERTAELAASEERFRQAFDFAGTGMAIVALNGRWLRVNRALCETVGYTETVLLQKSFQDITHPEDLAADLALLDELVAGKRRFYQMEKRYLHREGHVVWVRLTVSIVRDATQQPVHFVSQLEDIDEQKQLEESLARARDQALEASRMKSEFLATMSHEIRTPMNGVIGMTSLLRDTPLNSAQAEYVQTIEASGEALLSIINDILDYSKIEAGRIELELAPFHLRSCLRDALNLFLKRGQEKHLALRMEVAPDVPSQVLGDSTRLRQVLINLLSNALKFTLAGSVTLTVRAEPDGDCDRLLCAVSDTGIGIPPEGMDRLFKSFSQVDASTTRRFGGTGLGLAISKRLVELMGGTMWAESTAGRGSTFHFTVLVGRGSATETELAPDASAAVLDGTFGREQPLRVLVAEDNPVNQRVTTLLLKRLGYDALLVSNGVEAVAAVERIPFDVVLMDVEMPELDGCEATRRIRAMREGGTRPWIIALTAGAMQGDRDRAMASGMNDFVTKPVRAAALLEALQRAYTATRTTT